MNGKIARRRLLNSVEYFVLRFDVPGISAMNFILRKSLGGGGVASLRSDPQVTCLCS